MANPLSVNSANQFIGSKISLISKADIRYEGVLYSLDLREATISLAKVRSFGTEDRPTERPIPMKDEIYEFIIFRGADIKSIDVLEPPKNGSTLSCGLPQDPAIIEVSSHYRANGMGHGGHGACGMDHHHMRYNGRGGEGVFDGLLRGAGGRGVGRERGRRNNSGGRSGNGQFRGQGQGQGEGRRSRQDDGGYNGNGRRRSGSRRGQGQNSPKGILTGQGRGRSGDRAARTRGIIAPQQPPKVTFQDPFDFEKSNEEAKNAMEKLKMNGEAEGVEGSPVKDSEVKDNMGLNKEDMIYYDKDKFFDNISCEALERTKGRNSRPDWRAERKLNAETFGLTYNPQGQGQGGRGGRQGQGQGQGYNNNGGYRSYRYGGNGNYGQMRYNNSRNYGNRSYGRPQQMRN